MNIDQAFPSNYLKATELDGDVVFTIRNVEIETLGSGKEAEQKPIVYFNESDKGLVLNKTNANTIKGLYGPDTDNWLGKAITLFPQEVDFQGSQTLAIRVRMRKPGGGGTGAPAAGNSTLPAAALAQAKGRAWQKFQEMYMATAPDGTPALCAGEWKEALAAYFPGKRIPDDITAAEWDKFVADEFQRKPSPISSEPKFEKSEIPF